MGIQIHTGHSLLLIHHLKIKISAALKNCDMTRHSLIIGSIRHILAGKIRKSALWDLPCTAKTVNPMIPFSYHRNHLCCDLATKHQNIFTLRNCWSSDHITGLHWSKRNNTISSLLWLPSALLFLICNWDFWIGELLLKDCTKVSVCVQR